MYAANGTEIALLGEVELTLSMSGQEVTAAVVVFEEVDDLILGIDWLGRHRCRWSFTQNLIEIDGQVMRLISRTCAEARDKFALCTPPSTGRKQNGSPPRSMSRTLRSDGASQGSTRRRFTTLAPQLRWRVTNGDD